MRPASTVLAPALGLLLFLSGSSGHAGSSREASIFEASVAAYEAADQLDPPPLGGVLFIGSSSIELWATLEDDFPRRRVLNRGIGGTTIPDWIAFIGRLVAPYRPERIVFYAGDNDVAGGASAQQVLADFRQFVAAVQAALPGTRLYFLSIKPSPSRFSVWPVAAEANGLIAAEARELPGVVYVDVARHMLRKGEPRPELFAADLLHLSARGYALWKRILRRALRAGGGG